MSALLIFGLGYCGQAIAAMARNAGFAVAATSRSAAAGCISFDSAADALATATHVLTTAAPDATGGDPVLEQIFHPVQERIALVAVFHNLPRVGVQRAEIEAAEKQVAAEAALRLGRFACGLS